MIQHAYASPEAFKQALEQRLRASTHGGMEFARRRQILVFERFLARVVAVSGDAVTLKGGLALELRLERARTTKDVDLRLLGPPVNVGCAGRICRCDPGSDLEEVPGPCARPRRTASAKILPNEKRLGTSFQGVG